MPAAGPGICPCPAPPCPYPPPRGAGALLGATHLPPVRRVHPPTLPSWNVSAAWPMHTPSLSKKPASPRRNGQPDWGLRDHSASGARMSTAPKSCQLLPWYTSFQSSPYMHRGIRLLHGRPSSTFRLLRCQPVERPQWNHRCDRSRVDRTKGVYLYSVETPRRTAVRPCANLEGRARGFFDAAARRRLRHGHISKRLPLCPRCASAIVPTTGRRTACPPTLWRYSA